RARISERGRGAHVVCIAGISSAAAIAHTGGKDDADDGRRFVTMSEQRYRVGHRMSRRKALSLIGAVSLLPFDAVRGADVNPQLSCVATPAQTEGPYFVDERLNRADIRSDPLSGIVKEGVPLKLRLFAHAIAAGACTPL